ncbi:cytochrome P450 [Amycolatopsis solani]|uniref:cytochrome P450 n=1 Tax=Amycolatopsis solani TaxID=3028615 RepID=UPI00296F7220|nr:cytochrome P450 [Amycolatopsis sp. MEP2-6]
MSNTCPANVPLPLDPALPRTENYEDGASVLRSASFSVDVYHENAVLLAGTLLGSDGDRHRHLKRLEGGLFNPAHLAHYEKTVLAEVVDEELAALAANGDGVPRGDLIPLVRRMALRISAEVVGLDDIDDARLSHLTRLVARLGDGILIQWATRDHAEVMRDALAGKEEFWAEFVRPALEKRRGQARPGKDLISVLLADTTLSWSDDDILKEALLFMAAAAFTTATAVTHAVAELTNWLPGHPEAREKLADPEFLRVAGMESLRVHPGRHVLFRAAAERTTMPDGTPVEPGQLVLVDKFHANMDEEAYGGAAGEFDPYRTIAEGTAPYGLSFGAGPHQCLGKPLVLGTAAGRRAEPRDGTLALLLGALFRAGVERDPDHPPVRPDSVHDRYESFPVRFTAL